MQQVSPVYSKSQIVRASLAAVAIGIVVLVVFVLPAEYGIDPTRIGRLLNLTELARADATDQALGASSMPASFKQTEEKVAIRAGQGLEFKFVVERGAPLLYSWTATQRIYYEFHGEPTDPDLKKLVPFKTYEKNQASQSSGYLLPPFTGTHGWYWRNDSLDTIFITITGAGYYEVRGVL
jgi:hypothetical protein